MLQVSHNIRDLGSRAGIRNRNSFKAKYCTNVQNSFEVHLFEVGLANVENAHQVEFYSVEKGDAGY